MWQRSGTTASFATWEPTAAQVAELARRYPVGDPPRCDTSEDAIAAASKKLKAERDRR